ncbi:cytochrome c oxidase assembly protein COX16, mitochondrial [Scheffersomyces amazonensis]|uniref:cytochrome c oxidase assembly protein COX16, mitochondrial n=1 Tax=Scheffersomyces amazonensis TaxID=1078765 RepID=UPI00315D470C
MVSFDNRKFRGKAEQAAYDKTFAGKYQILLKRNHFLYFGLPFLISIVAGSLYLQKFTAVKWERWDERHRQLNEEEMMQLIENKRPIDKKNDYYRLQGLLTDHITKEVKSNDDYEIVRVQRKKEDEPVW